MKTRGIKNIILFVMTFFMAFTLAGCNPLQTAGKDNENGQISAESDDALNAAATLSAEEHGNAITKLAINDIPIEEKDYIPAADGSFSNILLDSEVFKYTFKMPDSSSIYPDFSTDNGKITISWFDDGEPALTVEMAEGSKEVYINGSKEPADMDTEPKNSDGKLYIPVRPFIKALNMTETFVEEVNMTLIHCQNNFSADSLAGNWSDGEEDLFATFKGASEGKNTIPSFAVGYKFNKDGTYSYIIIGADGFKDTLLQLDGKYKILGSTIVYYDIYESLYEGNPLELVHKELKRDKPFFEFIGDYNASDAQILLGDFWLNKITP